MAVKKKQEGKFVGKKRIQNFTQALLHWNTTENQRSMPWKGIKDPYKIWLSEIILQQTRVEQGLKYYERFIGAYPTVFDLAAAPEQEVFKLWEGLGYYSRCRNLIASARMIVTDYKGVFPAEYEKILSLKGIGPYTAAAIASFAYNLPYAVLDGNVFRVLARVHNVETPIDTTGGKKQFTALAQNMLSEQDSAAYNQAIMDFGATICKPVPLCTACFYQASCPAFLQGKQQLLPVKSKKTAIKIRWFHYIIVQHNDEIAIRQRTAKDIWQSLFEFILVESEQKLPLNTLLLQWEHSYGLKASDYNVLFQESSIIQKLSHQTIHFHFISVKINKQFEAPLLQWVPRSNLSFFPFPKTLKQYIHDNL